VIGHQAVAEDGKLMLGGFLTQQLKVDLTVSIGGQNRSSCIPALGNVGVEHPPQSLALIVPYEKQKYQKTSRLSPVFGLPNGGMEDTSARQNLRPRPEKLR
jgi:hypothetical protein